MSPQYLDERVPELKVEKDRRAVAAAKQMEKQMESEEAETKKLHKEAWNDLAMQKTGKPLTDWWNNFSTITKEKYTVESLEDLHRNNAQFKSLYNVITTGITTKQLREALKKAKKVLPEIIATAIPKSKIPKPLPADAENPTDLTLNSHAVTCYGKDLGQGRGRGYRVYCRKKG